MKDMISRIIELDKQAKADVAKANQRKIDSAQKISDIKEKKRNEYITRARTNIKMLEKDEKIKAYVKLKVIENSYKKISEQIDNVYEANKDAWIDAIVKKVIEA